MCEIQQDYNEFVLCAVQKVFIYTADSDKFANKVEEVINLLDKSIPDDNIKKTAIQNLQDYAKITIHNHTASNEELLNDYGIDMQEKLFREQAETFGIDLNDKDDEIAEIIRIGIKDLNPERVLKNCIHLYIKHGSVGLPAKWIGLSTAGFKYLYCTKQKFCLYGLSLDKTYLLFKSQYCNNCKYRNPHPTKWKWSYAWQKEQFNKFNQDVPDF